MRSRFLSALTAAAMIAFVAPAHAEDCSNAQTQTDMNQCAGRNYKAADRILNLVYQQAVAHARESDRDAGGSDYSYEMALRNAQRAWIAYREADCAPPPRELAGSISAMEQSDCLTQKTVQRTKELNERLGGE